MPHPVRPPAVATTDATAGVAGMRARVISKPQYKQVLPDPHCAWRYSEQRQHGLPFQLHYHTAYELALVQGDGHRFVGDSVEPFADGDLVLIGPELPHCWSAPAQQQAQTVQVLQIPAGWLDELVAGLPAMQSTRPMLQLARRGLRFSADTSVCIAALFAELRAAEPFDQFVTVIQILRCLKADEQARPLASAPLAIGADVSAGRIEKVIDYIRQHYTDDLRAEQLAKLAHMSTNHFHRFIKQRTDKTFNELVTELRIGKACGLLLNSSMQIASICSQCGFNDLSNFNRRFQQLKHCTPSEYRRAALRQVVPLSTTVLPTAATGFSRAAAN